MNIRYIIEFIDLAHTLNFNETAEHCFVSQPSLSKHIVSLENALGTKLFNRTKHSVELTEAGSIFYSHAQKIITAYNNAFNEIKLLNDIGENLGTLRISYLNTAVQGFLGKAISNFRKHYPNIDVDLYSGQLGETYQQLHQDEADLSISLRYPNSLLPHEWLYQDIYKDAYGCIVSLDSPLLKNDILRFADILDCPIAVPLLSSFPKYARVFAEWENKYGKCKNIVHRFEVVDTALPFAESGAAITIMPSHVNRHHAYKTRFIPLEGTDFDVYVTAIWKRNSVLPGVTAFVDALIAESKKLSNDIE